MSKSKIDDFLETFPGDELFDLIFSTFFPFLEEEEKQKEEKKKRKKRKARVKKDSPKPPKISEEEVETEDRGRRRRTRRGDRVSISTDTEEDFNPLERRRMRRGEKPEVEPKIEPKIIPYPLPERQAAIEQLTQEMANQTAQKFLECIPPEIKEVLTEEQLKYQQYELSMGIAEAVRTKLEWAMNQAWLDAKKNIESNSVD